jgi:hypothetical protein
MTRGILFLSDDAIRISGAAKFATAVMLCSWLTQALSARHTLDADGVSYLNIANSCLSGNWRAIVNGYWSPAYPFFLALWLKLFRPSPFQEPLAVKMLTFAMLVVALISFEYFLSAFFEFRKRLADKYSDGIENSLPDDAIRVLGYALFFWVTTFLIPAHLDQPDILVFVFYLVATSICMRLESSERAWRYHIYLGVALGVAYLAKAVMFPLSVVFFATLFFNRNHWRFLPRLLLTVVMFAAVSLPFILSLSKAKGRLTFGDAGAVNYHQMVMADENSTIFRVKPAAAPHIEEYTEIIDLGPYPPWGDPSYWYKGSSLGRLDFRRQLNRIHIVLRYYFDLYIVQLGGLVSGFLILLLFAGTFAQFGKQLLRRTILWLPAIAGLTLYALVRVEGRFLAGLTIALFAACFDSLRIASSAVSRKLTKSMVCVVSLLLLAQIAIEVGHEWQASFRNDNFPARQVAMTLNQMGLKTGERVSYMGDTLSDHVWAYLARVRIVAEIPQEDTAIFWAANQTERGQATNWLAARGARVLVTRGVPGTAANGWRRVGDTDYYVLPLRQEIHPAQD